MIAIVLLVCSVLLAFPLELPAFDSNSTTVRTKSRKNTKAFDLPIGRLYVDPNTWSKITENLVPGSTLELVHSEGDVFLAVVTSPDFVPAVDFISAFVEGMASAAPEVKDPRISKQRTVQVNGKQLTDVSITSLVAKQVFVYRGYLYTGRKGMCFIVTWTHGDLYQELKQVIEQVLDGYVVK
ncbi:MAG: hypothetical protein SGJ05_11955 [bacterium]|nr:hypothetical protein [bacterium]